MNPKIHAPSFYLCVVYFIMAERVGFEPTVHRCITGFQDRLHKPLGHLSVTCCTILAKGARTVNVSNVLFARI